MQGLARRGRHQHLRGPELPWPPFMGWSDGLEWAVPPVMSQRGGRKDARLGLPLLAATLQPHVVAGGRACHSCLRGGLAHVVHGRHRHRRQRRAGRQRASAALHGWQWHLQHMAEVAHAKVQHLWRWQGHGRHGARQGCR